MNSSLILGCQQPPFSIAVWPWNEQKVKMNQLSTNLLLPRRQVASSQHTLSYPKGSVRIHCLDWSSPWGKWCFCSFDSWTYTSRMFAWKPSVESEAVQRAVSRLQPTCIPNLQTSPLLEFLFKRIDGPKKVASASVSELQRGFRHDVLLFDRTLNKAEPCTSTSWANVSCICVRGRGVCLFTVKY